MFQHIQYVIIWKVALEMIGRKYSMLVAGVVAHLYSGFCTTIQDSEPVNIYMLMDMTWKWEHCTTFFLRTFLDRKQESFEASYEKLYSIRSNQKKISWIKGKGEVSWLDLSTTCRLLGVRLFHKSSQRVQRSIIIVRWGYRLICYSHKG